MNQHDKLRAITEKCCEGLGLYLVDLEIKGDLNKPFYFIFADTESGITLKECANLSRAIQDEIDFSDDFPIKYRIDVSSPGLERPLVEDFQFKKNLGKTLNLKIKEENKNIIGKLNAVGKNSLSIEDKNGNVIEYPREIIIEAKIKLQW